MAALEEEDIYQDNGLEMDQGKRIKLFKNGDSNFYGKEMVVNRRQVRTWDAFLEVVTSDLKENTAVRSIRTPIDGTAIQSLDELEHHCNYVAVTTGNFKPLKYDELESARKRTEEKQRLAKQNATKARPVVHNKEYRELPARFGQIPTSGVLLMIHSNGKNLDPPRRFLLTQHMLVRLDWIKLLELVSSVVNLDSGACKKIYSLDGQQITELHDLNHNEHYVAVGKEHFKPLDYFQYARNAEARGRSRETKARNSMTQDRSPSEGRPTNKHEAGAKQLSASDQRYHSYNSSEYGSQGSMYASQEKKQSPMGRKANDILRKEQQGGRRPSIERRQSVRRDSNRSFSKDRDRVSVASSHGSSGHRTMAGKQPSKDRNMVGVKRDEMVQREKYRMPTDQSMVQKEKDTTASMMMEKEQEVLAEQVVNKVIAEQVSAHQQEVQSKDNSSKKYVEERYEEFVPEEYQSIKQESPQGAYHEYSDNEEIPEKGDTSPTRKSVPASQMEDPSDSSKAREEASSVKDGEDDAEIKDHRGHRLSRAKEKSKAASKIQAYFRGYYTRKDASNTSQEQNDTVQLAAESSTNPAGGQNDHDEAAKKIQAKYKGYKARKLKDQSDDAAQEEDNTSDPHSSGKETTVLNAATVEDEEEAEEVEETAEN